MDAELKPIAERLGRLEQALVAEYVQHKRKAEEQGGAVISVPSERAEVFLTHLGQLEQQLYGNGQTETLRIVSEFHDELRIRMIYVRNLLERDIPHPYLERALADLKELRLAPAAERRPAASRPASESVTAAEAPARGWLGRLIAALARIFGLGRRAPASAASRPAAPVAPAASVPLPTLTGGTPMPEHVLRLLLLHRFMEDDELGLLPDSQRIPGTGTGLRLPPAFGQYYWRDLGEVHFASREEGPAIARTPEELRRKLAAREALKVRAPKAAEAPAPTEPPRASQG